MLTAGTDKSGRLLDGVDGVDSVCFRVPGCRWRQSVYGFGGRGGGGLRFGAGL